MTAPREDNETTAALKRALFAVKDLRSKLDASERAKTEPIAIIGVGCRFPGGVNSPEQYWKILEEQIDVITEVPAARWNIDDYYDPDQNAPGKMYVRKSGFVENVDRFEPQFFNISPREAMSMDPQQRLLMEVAWEALEYAGIVPQELAGSQTGVFIGLSTQDYSGMQLKASGVDRIDAYMGTGTSFAVAAGRIAYFLGVHGPTFTLDTACSSALVAIHLGVENLRAGNANLVLAGGVSLILAPEGTVSMSKSHALSPDGYCKPFDASADGYSRGEGCGIVVLKRLSDALADGDNIMAVIRGSAINHDGRSSGLTVPNGQAQQAVIKAALANTGGVEPLDVQYIEAHGTGTQLGDPIEVRALANVLGVGRSKDSPLILGSVKANIGHLEAAAGMASLVKVILALRHEKIPAQIHLKELNPLIDWESFPVKVAGEGEAWPRGDKPRIAGLNSFGFSGTNAHLVVEEPPLLPEVEKPAEKPQSILALSGRDSAALADQARNYAAALAANPEKSLAELTASANTRRTHFTQRLAVVGSSAEQIRAKLEAFAADGESAGVITGSSQHAGKPKIAFLFTGQGSQYLQMGRQLYQTEPVFRAALDRCDAILSAYLDRSLLSILYPQGEGDSPINDTGYTQPALFAIEYALAELWRSWGIVPAAVMGHSVGEYAAACVAGLFSLEDGLKLIAERGRLMQSLPRNGTMAAVFANLARVEQAIAQHAGQISIAAVNGPENIVISGLESSVQAVLDSLAADSIKASKLAVSHAFHSAQMDPILDAFERAAASISYQKPKTALISNVTGKAAGLEELSRPGYWRSHIRKPVQFQTSIETLREQGFEIFLEIGPQPTLLGMAQRCISDAKYLWLASLRQRKEDLAQMLESLGGLYVNGIECDWKGFYRAAGRPFALPTYPFQRQRYWFQSVKQAGQAERDMLHPLLSRKIRSPRFDGTIFESEIGVEFPAFLNDHRIFEAAVFPGTGYIEAALAAAKLVFGSDQVALRGFSIDKTLVLPEEGDKKIQVIVSPVEDGQASVEIYSLDGDDDAGDSAAWTRHASGTMLRPAVEQTPQAAASLAQYQAACTNPAGVSDFYQRMAGVGIEQGPAFRSLVEIFEGTQEALGKIALPPEEAQVSSKYLLHPALLDAAFQVIAAASTPEMREANDALYVPTNFESLKVYQPGLAQAWAHAVYTSPVQNSDGVLKDELTGSIKLFTLDGAPAAELDGLHIRKISRDAIRQSPQRSIENWLYQVEWNPAASPPISRVTKPWLIFADESGMGASVARQMKAQGLRVTVVRAGAEYAGQQGEYRVDPTNPEHFQRLIEAVKAELGGKRPGILHLWSAENPFDAAAQKTGQQLQAAQNQICGSILHLVQALGEKNVMPEGLWLVTQGAVTVRPEDSLVGPAQGSLWGLGRTIAQEYPNWKCACVDVLPDGGDQLVDEVLGKDEENQIALRAGKRYVARLERPKTSAGQFDLPAEPFELRLPTNGVLDELALIPAGRPAPQAGEVEIRVRATGLNFRDVLNALGMYPGAKIPAGIECAGVITAVGSGVRDFKVGDAVIGLVTGAFRAYAVVPEERVFRKPANLSFAEAVSIPTTFLTAAYGLHHLAKMQAGDRVLIHAAAGGVGLAAVQLVQHAGAEVYATAGSPEKRAYLKSLGVQHIFDSRSLDFAAGVMQATQGRGVNIVLNSLADDFIPASLSVMAQNGVFLEIGKRDDWDAEKVRQRFPTLSYHRYDLGTEMVNDLPFVGGMLKEMLAAFEQGTMQVPPVRVFPMQSVREAFRYMAQAKHIGKIVIAQAAETAGIRADGSYLVTGGLGGLGLVTARWLVERGAKQVVLVSRRAPSDEARAVLAELAANGAQITALQGDMAVKDDVERIIAHIQANLPVLRGVFHEAGVLDDGILSQQTLERFNRVLAPKVYGAWYLHQATQNIPLDYFVLFSSASAVVGTPGQGNYAAANAALDALAHYRRSLGMPAMSINWGAWAEVGMAAKLEQSGTQRRAAQTADEILPAEGTAVLDLLLKRQAAQVVVLPVQWNRVDSKSVLPILRQLVRAKSNGKPAKSSAFSLEQLKSMPPAEQKDALLAYSRQQVTAILGLDATQRFDAEKALTNLGMDSLMAVELKNKLMSDLSVNIDVSYFLEQATVSGLSEKIYAQLGGGEEAARVGSGDGSMAAEQAEQILSNLDQLSEDEVNALLNDLLSGKETP